MQSLKGRAPAGKDGANTAEPQARETLDRLSKLRALVKGLDLTVSGDRASISGIDDAELVDVRLVITAALLESESPVCDAVRNVCNGTCFLTL